MDEFTHVGKRSLWDGTVRTLCGLRLPKTARYLLFVRVSCPTCRAAQKAKKNKNDD
jgi:hypothetical protein